MTREFKRIDAWYVDNTGLTNRESFDRDGWCLQTFGDYRHDYKSPQGWWLQSEEELALFLLRWGVKLDA